MTARELIVCALQEIGAIASNETATNADATTSLVRLNSLIDLWQIERLAIATITRSVFTLVASQGSYTLGPTGDWVFPVRPQFIQRAAMLDTSNYEAPIEIATDDRWAAELHKALTSTDVTAMYYRRTVPNGTVSLWPVPTDATVQAVLYIPTPLTGVLDLTTELVLPPGYEEALRYNLAVRLAPVFSRPVDPTLNTLAVETKAAMKRANARPQEMTVDPAITGGGAFDIYTGGL
jgi:hypothetical protein